MAPNAATKEIAAAFARIEEQLAIIRKQTTAPPPPTKSARRLRQTAPPQRNRRRDAMTLNVLAHRIAAAVAASGDGGLNARELRNVLRLRKDELAHPLRIALLSGMIRVKGVKKAARYFPGKSS